MTEFEMSGRDTVSVARVTARTNRRAAVTAADWAWRHHEPLGALVEVLDVLGISKTDRGPADVVIDLS
jgi:hypothetical protein